MSIGTSVVLEGVDLPAGLVVNMFIPYNMMYDFMSGIFTHSLLTAFINLNTPLLTVKACIVFYRKLSQSITYYRRTLLTV